jgi:hypothetical protein
MMGGTTTETCSAVNKRQDNKLENCGIWLVIYLNCTMMHGFTNLKNGEKYAWPVFFGGLSMALLSAASIKLVRIKIKDNNVTSTPRRTSRHSSQF